MFSDNYMLFNIGLVETDFIFLKNSHFFLKNKKTESEKYWRYYGFSINLGAAAA